MKAMAQEKEVAEMKAEATEVALGSCEGELAALKQQSGEDRHSLEQKQAHQKLERANATVKKYEENEEAPGNVPAATLAQIKLLRDQLGDQVSLLSKRMEANQQETMQRVENKLNEQDATMAGMFQHQTEVLNKENNVRHARVESMLCNVVASMVGALQIGGSQFAPPDEEEVRRLVELRSSQMDEEKRIKSRQKWAGALS